MGKFENVICALFFKWGIQTLNTKSDFVYFKVDAKT